MLTFDLLVGCNNDVELSILTRNITTDRGIPVDCGHITIVTLHLSKEEVQELYSTLTEYLHE